ncbi:MAG: hypothetical protein Q8Q04_00155 [archaeon]|nr:hypothetical protein [archaeon]
MENKRKIEFLIGGMLIILLLIFILGVLYFDSKEEKTNKSFKLYESHSELILKKDFYYEEENSRTVSYENGVHQEKISRNNFLNLKNEIFLENKYYFEETSYSKKF